MKHGLFGWLCTGLFGSISILEVDHILQLIAILGTIFASIATGLYYLRNTFYNKTKKKRKK